MNYIIYKTTNLLNGMYYIGCHQTNDIDDGYLGSGKHLVRSIRKHGRDNFTREILNVCSSKEEMFEVERSIVNETLVKDPATYNLKIGGSGGNPGIVGAFTGHKHAEETKEKQRQASLKQVVTDDARKKMSENNWAKRDPEGHRENMRQINKGKPKSAEHRRKISEALKRRHAERNLDL